MSSFKNLVLKLLFLLLAPSVATIGLRLAQFDWFDFPYIWLVIPISVIVISIIIIIIRFRQIGSGNIGGLVMGVHDYPTRYEYPHEGVIWHIGIRDLAMSASDVEVKTPPRCPKCKTELGQSKSFWGGRKWKCPRGDFMKKSKKSFYEISKSLEKIVRRDWEEGKLH